MSLRKINIVIPIFGFCFNLMFSQHIKSIQKICNYCFDDKIKINYNDSSLYTIFKVNNNICFSGKYGVLKCIESDSIFHKTNNIFHSNVLSWIKQIIDNKTILKSIYLSHSNTLYLFTNDGTAYRFNINEHIFKYKTFKELHNKAIYNASIINDTNIIICGGNKKVSKGKIAFSKGFVAVVDTGFHHVNILWNNFFRFVWNATVLSDNSILITAFNGLNSRIIKIEPYHQHHVQTISKIKGLIYKVYEQNSNNYVFFGANSFRYKKNGMIGIISDKKTHYKFIFKDVGCIWDAQHNSNYYYLSTDKGKIISISQNDFNNKNFQNYALIDTNIPLPIYEILSIHNKLYLAYSKNVIGIIEFMK